MAVDIRWKLTHIGPALIVSSGLVFMSGKHPRGFTLERVVAMFKAHPRKGYYEETMRRRVTLGDVVERGRFQDIGKVVPMYSAIDLYRALRDRDFHSEPQSGGQLLNRVFCSKPVKVREG